MAEKIIGVDLGTSNSAAAVMLGGKPTIIPSAEGATIAGKMFPSVVAFTRDGQLLVGEPARRQAVSNPEGTIFAIKRKMGTDYKARAYGKEYTPQQVSAFILQKIKRDAEAFLGEPVKKAVITVPAYFNDNQRQATKDAGQIAGLEVVRIINEPTAASLAYGIDKSGDHTIMVFDLGGGTLDVTILEFGEGVFEVKATSGDTQLGGTDMDAALVDYLVDEFKKESGIDLKKDSMAMQRLREAAEKAKIELSTVLTTDINLPYITADASGPKHFSKAITRARLEEIIRPIIERCRHPMEQALTDAKMGKADIKRVVLVGGPTRMPVVQRFVEEYAGKKIERGVDPMECVAVGAAIQGAVLSGETREIVLLDVTPLTLSIETLGGIATAIIQRNTTIPTKKSQTFTTAADFQTAVTVHVVQGERSMAADNTSLGMFNLTGIPPAPRGVPQIEVEFDIDANGILNVTAKDLGTGKSQKITITASTKMPKEQIDKLSKEAERFAEEDRRKKEEAEARNNADSLIYATEKTLAEFADKASAEQKKTVDDALKALRDALGGKDVEEIKRRTDALSKAVQEIGAAVYRQAGASAEKQGGETVDAEYKVEDEKERK
jgi:molecular chaperone DnaK